MNASVRNVPDCTNVSATSPEGFSTSVDVTKTIAANGTRITAIVLNCRLQVRRRADLDRRRDLDHLRRSLIVGEHVAHQVQADEDRHHGREAREQQDEHLTALERERLIAAFRSEHSARERTIDH